MKILDAKPFAYLFECHKCGSQLEAEAEDVQVGYFGANYGGDRPERTYYVTCPVCGTDKTLGVDELTPAVRQLADGKESHRG